jgi:hypothetical protein
MANRDYYGTENPEPWKQDNTMQITSQNETVMTGNTVSTTSFQN